MFLRKLSKINLFFHTLLIIIEKSTFLVVKINQIYIHFEIILYMRKIIQNKCQFMVTLNYFLVKKYFFILRSRK